MYAIEKPGSKHLPSIYKPFFSKITEILRETNFFQNIVSLQQRGKFVREILTFLDSFCTNEDDVWKILQEIERYVRWDRLTGYWLSYFMQLYLAGKKSPYFILAARIYADAQISLNEDLALSSMENAYHKASFLRDLVPEKKLLTQLVEDFQKRLKLLYKYYRHWYRPVPFTKVNSLTEHLYFELTFGDLRSNFSVLDKPKKEILSRDYFHIINTCTTPETFYWRIIARRHLGLWYENLNNWEAAIEEYRQGLREAYDVFLEAEIGHLHRLLGYGLCRIGQYEEAIEEFTRALAHEEHPSLSFWRALTERELGDAYLKSGNLQAALQYYRKGRKTFENYIARSTIPVARGVAQQMFRSYTGNALQTAALLQSKLDTLSEWEAAGPRMATEIVAESRYATFYFGEDYRWFCEVRNAYYSHLGFLKEKGSIDDDFQEYLKEVIENYPIRKGYIETRVNLTPLLTRDHSSDETVQRLLSLDLDDYVFLMFHPDEKLLFVFIADMHSKDLFQARFPIDRHLLIHTHERFHQHVQSANFIDLSHNDPFHKMKEALDELLAFYSKILTPLLKNFLPFIKGRKVKIFPRLFMNQVPFHALIIDGHPLIDLCQISYGLTFGVFLQVHRPKLSPSTKTLVTVYDEKGAPLYQGGMKLLQDTWGADFYLLNNPNFDQFISLVQKKNPTDIFFACHGKYDHDDPASSYLRFRKGYKVSFERLFSELDLRNCHCVTLGACESGLGRSIVSAEFIGLPVVFLASGVRYVIGSLWQVNQLAASILLSKHYQLTKEDSYSVIEALNTAQKYLRDMSQDELSEWLKKNIPSKAKVYQNLLQRMGEKPFSHPYYWAGFYVIGDVDV